MKWRGGDLRSIMNDTRQIYQLVTYGFQLGHILFYDQIDRD